MTTTRKIIASVLVVPGCIAIGMLLGLIICGLFIVIPLEILAAGLDFDPMSRDGEQRVIVYGGFIVAALLYYICMTQYVWTKETP